MRAKTQICSAEEAVAAIPDGACVAVGGFVGAGHPESLTAALERHFIATGAPRDLTLFYCAGQGDREDRGLNHLAHKGLIRRVVGGHWNLAPKMGTLALANEIEAYNFPQGVLCVLLREIAAKRPGIFTHVGMHTFIDPINGGGRLNARTTEPLVERVDLDGTTWLWYKSIPITVGLIRATTADRQGNLAMEREAFIGEVLPIAQAAKNHGGIVIAQVERIVDRIEDPKAVRVPGTLVDYLVLPEGREHDQTFAEKYNDAYVTSPIVGGEGAIDPASSVPPIHAPERRLIGARALREIPSGAIVNLGIGMPEGVAAMAAETGRASDFTLTVESGPTGGFPASGLSFGCSHFPEAIIDQPSQFDYYDGGGIDIAALGAAEIDAEGSVNVTHFVGRFAGIGGFANISQNAKRLVFCCTFRAGHLKIAVEDGELRIENEGKHAKFVPALDQVSFHGPSALARGQQVLYVTERAVFELTPKGLVLVEVAPGMDVQRDILGQMDFVPSIASDMGHMDLSLAYPTK